TSWPSSTKQITKPVSWQYGILRVWARSALFCRSRSTCLPASDRSVVSARANARRMSGSSSMLASMQSFLTASVTALTWMSRTLMCSPASELQLLDQLTHGRGGLVEGRLLVGRERDLDDLLDAAAPELHRHPDVKSLRPVLPFEIRGAGKDLLLVLENRLHHLDGGGGGRVVGAARLQIVHDLGADVGRARDQRVDRVIRQEIGDLDPGHRCEQLQRHYGSAVTTETV